MDDEASPSDESCALTTKRLLVHDAIIQGHSFRAGTQIETDAVEGFLVRAILTENHVLDGICCRGRAPVPPKDGGWFFYVSDLVAFHQNSLVKRAFLVEDQLVDGMPCKGDQPVERFDNGSIAGFTLAEATAVHLRAALGDFRLLRVRDASGRWPKVRRQGRDGALGGG